MKKFGTISIAKPECKLTIKTGVKKAQYSQPTFNFEEEIGEEEEV